ncbi:hypothetical protein ACLMAB_22535 [Brevibacillus laterosporus]|nr:hypothetical protein [Brevibacillus laterosporus]
MGDASFLMGFWTFEHGTIGGTETKGREKDDAKSGRFLGETAPSSVV